MGQRLQLHSLLVEVLGSGNVYFQPPANIQMQYPCIVYGRDMAQTRFADNNPYSYKKRYQVTVVARDPDSDIPDKVAAMPLTTFSRAFVVDNLHHDVFMLYH